MTEKSLIVYGGSPVGPIWRERLWNTSFKLGISVWQSEGDGMTRGKN